MQRDIRDTLLFREAHEIYSAVRRPGSGQISDAAELNVSPDQKQAAFTGAIAESLENSPSSRICRADLVSGDVRVLTEGPNSDRLPKYSPDGSQIAFLSDRQKPGDFQLHLIDLVSGSTRSTPSVNGWVEYLHWSPDGRKILLGVAGHGADISGAQGGLATPQVAENIPAWAPTVETGNEAFRWRGIWVFDLASAAVSEVALLNQNVWEATWCGNNALVAVVSAGPGEESWYDAWLQIVEMGTGVSRPLYEPQDQLAWVASSSSGRHVAVVEALCSDRHLVAGDLLVIEVSTGTHRRVDTAGVDISFAEWRDDRYLLIAGHRGFESVVGVYDQMENTFKETWSSAELTTSGVYLSVSGIGSTGDCAIIGESYLRAPEIAVIRKGAYESVRSFDLADKDTFAAVQAVERVSWNAPDGLQIQGWLLRPRESGPRPMVMYVHGGPIWHWRPVWLGRGSAAALMLLRRGYSIFYPNPRGSSGRGQAFARRVLHDMGGADAGDFLSGIDDLVARGQVDAGKLGLIGASYGGFMTSWLIARTSRFSAAISIAPMINYVSQHLLSNIPKFVSLFLGDSYTNMAGEYFKRSPIMYAHKVKTPTLNICGALDRSAPPEEAVQFHNALLENGVRSALLTYPGEGHGVRKFPAMIDYAARVVGWFEEHIAPGKQASS